MEYSSSSKDHKLFQEGEAKDDPVDEKEIDKIVEAVIRQEIYEDLYWVTIWELTRIQLKDGAGLRQIKEFAYWYKNIGVVQNVKVLQYDQKDDR